MPIPRGGGAKLADALVQLIRDRGGTCETGVDVERILVQSGRATGVRAASGETISAERAVIAERPPVAGRALVMESSPAVPAWRADPAFLSRDDGREFLRWFQRTSVKETDQGRHLGQVPLSRVYTVADEARRRAAWWSDFALQLEGRTKQASRPA